MNNRYQIVFAKPQKAWTLNHTEDAYCIYDRAQLRCVDSTGTAFTVDEQFKEAHLFTKADAIEAAQRLNNSAQLDEPAGEPEPGINTYRITVKRVTHETIEVKAGSKQQALSLAAHPSQKWDTLVKTIKSSIDRLYPFIVLYEEGDRVRWKFFEAATTAEASEMFEEKYPDRGQILFVAQTDDVAEARKAFLASASQGPE